MFLSFAAGVIALRIAVYLRKQSIEIHHILLLCLYAAGCFFFAGEEISWGQRIFGFRTETISEMIASTNKQDEFNLHNIPAFQRVRIIADVFCGLWGIAIPLFYRYKLFPIPLLRMYISPVWMLPAYAACLLITQPNKWLSSVFPWILELRLGEIKETCVALVFLLYIIHLDKTFRKKPVQLDGQ